MRALSYLEINTFCILIILLLLRCHMGNGSPLLFFSFGPLYHPYYHSSVLKHICAYRCLFPSMNDRRGLPRFGIPLRSFIFYIYTFSAVP